MSINRFISAYKLEIKTVRKELLNTKKETHWIWFIFPQLKGLGKSEMSNYYGMSGIEEAKEFYDNRYLRHNLNSLLKIMLSYKLDSLEIVLGDIDTIKFHSFATLFYLATGQKIFKMLLDKFYNSCLDKQTMLLLKMR